MKKRTRIIIDVLLIIVGIIFLIFGIKDAVDMYKNSKIDDNTKFSRSYTSVDKENIYKYRDLKEIDSILKEDKGIILIGKTTDPWMQVLVNPLHNIVEDYTDSIYYLELDNIKESNDYYKKVTDKTGNLSSPTILIVKDGKILTTLHKSDLIDEEYDGIPLEYYTDERVEELRNKLDKITELN